jgi:hypothetical protein
MTSSHEAKMGKHKPLRDLISGHDEEYLKKQIVDIDKAYLESERVLRADTPQTINQIIEHVRACKTEFVTPEHPCLSPALPPEFAFDFAVPTEVTVPRERIYFLDREGKLRELHVEVRQERKEGLIMQTTKVGNGANFHDSTMDRMEQKSKLKGFGFNVYAIGDKDARHQILDEVISIPKPVLRLVSQRTRILYHPEGNPNVRIELALEPLHFGQTFTGYQWMVPKIDIEIKVGPAKKDKALRHAILAREEERLMSLFPLTRELKSSATPGFEAIDECLRRGQGVDAFDRMGTTEQWWLQDRRDRSLKYA